MISELFGERIGTFEKGSVADFIVMGYVPPTPLTPENLAGHFLSGMRSSMVESVMVEGNWILRDLEFTNVDARTICQKARRVAQKLWKTMAKQ